MSRVRKKLFLKGFVLLMVLALTGAAWAVPADTTSNEQKNSNTQPVSVFMDVQAGDSNLIYINYLSKREIISGFPDGGFHPNEGLSRAQAATLLAKAAGLSSSEKKAVFKDVDAGYWAACNINAAAAAGYLKGYPDGTYHPEEKLSRAQGISLVLRLTKQKDNGVELPSLKDLDSKHWAARSAAIGLAAGMVGLTSDKTQFLPNDNFSRGDLTRALAILLTTDPDLSQVPLNGSLEIKKGEVKVNDQVVTDTVSIKAGELIVTAAGAEAQLSYPDGSGLLIKENSQLTVKETRGRSYIMKDGSPGTAVDWLLVDVKKGNIFGALAANPNLKVTGESEKKTSSFGEKLLADMSGALEYLAAGEKELPWYKTAEAKKVKVKIDMPYGVAAVRGSFWNNIITDTGCSTSLLEGDASVTAGGQTLPLPPGQSSTVNSANPVPTSPAPMTAAQVTGWTQQANWLQTVVQAIQSKQEAVKTEAVITIAASTPVPGQTIPLEQIPFTPPTQAPTPVVPDIMTMVNQALTQVQQSAGFTQIITLSPASDSQSNTIQTTQNTNTSPISEEQTSSIRNASWYVQDITSIPNGTQTLLLTREFGVISPSTLSAATRYQLLGKSSEVYYRALTGILPLSEKSLQLASLFDNPENLMVKFFNENKECVGNYCLNSNTVLTNMDSKTISGTILLPAGDVAPSGGIGLIVRVSGNYIGGWGDFQRELTIPAGASSLDYSIPVPDNINSANLYSVHYHIKGDYQGSYALSGHYSSLVNVISGSQSNIDMNIVSGKTISGKFILPSITNRDIKASILIYKSGESGYYKVTRSKIIPSGTSELTFNWVAEPGYSYQIRYGIEDAQFCSENHYLPYAFYSSSGTVLNKNMATAISISTEDVSGINIPVKTGRIISGTISLPNGETAPAGGLVVNLSTDVEGLGPSENNNWIIGEGQNGAGYAMVVPPGTYTLYFQAKDHRYYGNYYQGKITVIDSDVSGHNFILSKSPQFDPWSSPEAGKFPAIASADIANNSLVIGRYAYGPDSLALNSVILLDFLEPNSSLFYKSASGQWYDLRTGSAAVTHPPIYYYFNNQIYLNIGNQESIYPAYANYPRCFTVSPLDAQVSASSTNSSLFNLEIPSTDDQGRIWGKVVTGDPGTAQLTLGVAAPGFTALSLNNTIKVVPRLNICTPHLESGYTTTNMTVSSSVYEAQWSSTDVISLDLFKISTGTIVENPASYLTNPVVGNNSISFTLSPGLDTTLYGIKVIKGSETIGIAAIDVEPQGNQMFCESATYDSSTGKLVIKMGWMEYAGFDLSKLTFKTLSGAIYNLNKDNYTFEPNPDLIYSGQYGMNNGLVIMLNTADKAAIASLAGFSEGISFDAAAGWSKDCADNPAVMDIGTPITKL